MLQDDHIPEDAMDLAAPVASPTVSVSSLFILTKLVRRDGPYESSLTKMVTLLFSYFNDDDIMHASALVDSCILRRPCYHKPTAFSQYIYINIYVYL